MYVVNYLVENYARDATVGVLLCMHACLATSGDLKN